MRKDLILFADKGTKHRRIKSLEVKLKREIERGNMYAHKLSALEALVREYCDETEYDGESMRSRELRQWVWNDADTEAQIQAEGYDES